MATAYTRAELADLLSRDVSPDQPRLYATLLDLLPEDEPEEQEEPEAPTKPRTPTKKK